MKPDEGQSAQQPVIPGPAEEEVAVGKTFGDEVKDLLGGLGWGVRWLGLSLAWGLCLFAFFVLIGYAVWGDPIDEPGPYYGLIVVVGLLTLILSMLRRRI